MTESLVLSKERSPEKPPERQPDEKSDYYYDDSTGYRIYNPECEDDEADDNGEEDRSVLGRVDESTGLLQRFIQDNGNGIREIMYLIIAVIGAGIDDQIAIGVARIAADRPVDCPCHILDVDQWPPRRSVALDLDFAGRVRAGNQVIEDDVAAQAWAAPFRNDLRDAIISSFNFNGGG